MESFDNGFRTGPYRKTRRLRDKDYTSSQELGNPRARWACNKLATGITPKATHSYNNKSTTRQQDGATIKAPGIDAVPGTVATGLRSVFRRGGYEGAARLVCHRRRRARPREVVVV
ncbi:hypothetical protein Bbelb_388180 [Branchiostoma belcheri]|nr:hypothetical protein Bbelb_388180 [Branchiostoma belcheri]